MSLMLKKARADGYAVGAFNILDFNSMKAVIESAEELDAPVILQTSVKTVKFWGHDAVMSWTKHLAQKSAVPVALHLDHCTDIDYLRRCIESGWSSVMIDASSLPYEENIELSQQAVEMAKPHGVSVEAELGAIGGVEDDISVADEDARLADPKKAECFMCDIPLDCFAPAVGTAHGLYKGVPKIDFERLETIAAQSDIPLALHGGTGLADDVFLKCISLGCAKVNISTQLKYSFIDSFVEYYSANKEEYNPLKLLGAQLDDLKLGIRKKIVLFGSAGKASVGA